MQKDEGSSAGSAHPCSGVSVPITATIFCLKSAMITLFSGRESISSYEGSGVAGPA
jgi:hypothetical protein